MSATHKQVIIVNMAANMPIGRLTAQACHASLLNILNRGEWKGSTFSVNAKHDPDLEYWMKEGFTKVVFKEWGEDRLMEILKYAQALGLQSSSMVEDDDGLLTLTAIALGPAESSKLEPITKNLILL